MDKIIVRMGFDTFPSKYTCSGEDVSFPFDVEGGKGTSMAVILDDPDAPMGTWVHWVIWNIRPIGSMPENVAKKQSVSDKVSAVQGSNSFGRIGYNGPCPPRGPPHRYFLKVYVLDADLDLGPGATKEQLLAAMEGHVLQYGEAMARYSRK
jgi:Raf kinase inhibitor-like YbhB/YbcL family protein